MDESLIAKRLEVLRVEHRDLDSAIGALIGSGALDQLQLARFKKRKLRLRDEIAMLEDQLAPDIIASGDGVPEVGQATNGARATRRYR